MICNKTRVIYHVILAFISHDIEPDVCIRGFSFIFEVDSEEMTAFVSILRTDLTSLMNVSSNNKCVLNKLFGYHPQPIDIIQTTKIATIAIDKRYRILQMCLLAFGLQTSNNIIRTHNLSCEWCHLLTKVHLCEYFIILPYIDMYCSIRQALHESFSPCLYIRTYPNPIDM